MLTIDEQRLLNVPKLYKMKKIAYTVNREGVRVEGNGFKQNEPIEQVKNSNIWMHSIERTDAANPIEAFTIFILCMALFIGILIAMS